MPLSINHEAFLTLVRLGIGHHSVSLHEYVDWNAIEALAAEQGLSAVVVDGVEKLPIDQRPPEPVLVQWIGETLQGYEYRNELCCRAIAELASFYNQHGYKMMVLKGFACSLNWLKPEHRPCGDIDIWQFGQQKEADEVLRQAQGSKFEIDSRHHHHTVFYWRGFMVENHYDFVNVHAEKSSKELEKVFKELGKDDSHFVELYGEKVYLPSPNLHALFLLRHMVSHFSSTKLSLRQILDWGFFVKAYAKEIDWNWLDVVLENFHMKDFYNCMNAICVEDLGFDVSIFKSVHFMPDLKERILKDALDPEFGKEDPRRPFLTLLFKYRRWRANAWKRELCYAESRWSAFWSGIWNHLLKPRTI